MAQLTRRIRAQASRVNQAIGRKTGRAIAPSPLPNSLPAELRNLLAGLHIDHVLDVGAHRGGFARRLRTDVGYRGRITSFEPSPAHFRALFDETSDDPNWSAVNVALGAKEGKAEFHQFKGDGQFDSLRPLGPHAAVYKADVALEETVEVTVKRLDAIWPDLVATPAQTFVKVDTQGFDLEVLSGAGDLLEQFPAVLMEVAVQPLYAGAPVVSEVFRAMDANGFELTGAFPIHRYAQGLRVIEFDCTFVNQRQFGPGGASG
jgi:FkbM family methyltransferase